MREHLEIKCRVNKINEKWREEKKETNYYLYTFDEIFSFAYLISNFKHCANKMKKSCEWNYTETKNKKKLREERRGEGGGRKTLKTDTDECKVDIFVKHKRAF